MVSSNRITVHCVGNAHIDPVWRWPWQEGYAETLATCRAAIDRLRESDDFVFSRGQAATYVWIEEADPEMFAEIQKYVKEGRWNIINGWWEQPDCNVPCGESYVRHALYGKRYFREKFGVEVTAGWNPDTFGHNGGLPQILQKSGFKTYTFFRPGANEKDLPGPFFWWQGPDGSRVLGVRPPVGHYGGSSRDLLDNIRKTAETVRELGLSHSIVCYGVGNHGGGPTKESIANIRSLRENPDEPNAIFSTIEALYDGIIEKADTFPTVADDLQHHAPGCYTTHSEIKRLNRKAENELMAAERWSAIASIALGRAYPVEEFAHAWKLVLFNQFHDVLAGTSLPSAYDVSRLEIGEAQSIASRHQNAALHAIAAHVDTRVDASEPPASAHGDAVLLFNPSSWDRTDPVTVQWAWHRRGSGRLVDDSGNEVPFQLTMPDVFGGGTRIHFEASVPAHGYRVYRFLRDESAPDEQVIDGSDARTRIARGEPFATETTLENALYRLEFDPSSGALTRLHDKTTGVEAVSGQACDLLVINDPGDTWGHDIASWRDVAGRFEGASFTITENGPSRATLRIDTRWNRSTARQEFTLYRDCPRIDVKLTVDWHEEYKMLKLSAPVAVKQGVLTYDTPYSTIVRKANGNEDPGQNWIDLTGVAASGSKNIPYGVSLLNDSKFGFDCLDNDLRMTILRSPIYCFHDPAKPEPGKEYHFMDQGTQVVNYALLPHAGGWQDAGTTRQATALNNPFVFQFQYPHEGDWGSSGSLLRVDPPNVIAAAMKGAEDGEETILRLFESQGAAGTATVTLPGGEKVETRLGAWELKTLRLGADGSATEVTLLED